MTPTRIFDAYFSEDGGHARLSGHAAEDRFDERRRVYRRFLSDCCAQLAQKNVTLNVYFDFVDSPEINAAAGRVGDLYLLDVNYGTLESLTLRYNASLSWPEVLPAIGDPAAEVVETWDAAGSLDLTWQPKSQRVAENASRLLIRRGLQRQQASICLVILAMDFIVCHEFSHIMAGDLGFLESQGAALRVNESRKAVPLADSSMF